MGEAMNLLADLYSTIDSKKRQLKGLLSDPVETIRQGLLNFRYDQSKLLNDFGVGYQTPGYKSVLTTPEQVKAARQSVADWGANQGIGAATVWHGSPHKFNKFDSSKIGTGEGAQAYGHGLYLAESPTVAKQYADSVKDMGAIKDINKELSRLADVMQADTQFGQYRKFKSSVGEEAAKQYDELMAKRSGVSSAPGNMYKVDLPDEAIAKMLDWDKPVSAQPQAFAMSEALYKARAAKEATDSWKVVFDDRIGYAAQKEGAGLIPLGAKTEAEALAKLPSVVSKAGPAVDDGNWIAKHTGQELINSMNSFYGPAKAAEILRQQGIPGIRYLDGGSRSAGQGTSNYVIFPGNESLLTILERNGQPVGLLD